MHEKMSTLKINDEVTVGGQPTAEELQQYGRLGFKSVINFRNEGEDNEQVDPAEEGRIAQEHGMAYLHVPVSMKSMSPAAVDEFRSKFTGMPKPAFAHCKSGKRAGAMVMIDMACRRGMSGEETLQQAEEMGFECDNPQLREFVSSYVDQHA
jgi:uncharacterized protein (TIGR01244 family)